ncbi:MAG TPA: ATP-binding cassette domain-containing protein, partial [Candidatus Dormibacteraeota bacterium]|nr:ATP-binding cassette domain-containing protein [Candidatus Dormibacteraeota bacterium]
MSLSAEPVNPGRAPSRFLPRPGGRRAFAVRAGVLLLAALAFLTAPAWLSPGDEYIAGLAVIAVLLALSYNLMLGSTGMVSFGHAGFYGIGAFTVALVVTKAHGNALLGLGLAPVIGAVAGVLVGAFCLRAVRLYFSLLTLAVSQLLYVAAFEAYDITGGDNGIHGIAIPDFLNDPATIYYFVLAVVAGCAALLLVITRSPFGYALNAIRENRQRAAFLGLRVKAYELAAFTISSSLAAVAGALYALYEQQAFPGLMFWTESGTPVVMALVGGLRTFLGPAFGAVFYAVLEAKVKNSTNYWDLIIGGLLLAIVLLLPGGFAGIPARFRDLRRPKQSEGELAQELGATVALAQAPVAGAISLTGKILGTQAQPRGARVAPRDDAPVCLEVRGLSKRFGALAAVDGVDLAVRSGGVHAVIGPNGAGKSTLFSLISGQHRPDYGTVSFEGRDVTGAAPHRLAHAGIGRAFQTTSIFPGLTVADNVRLALMSVRGDTRVPAGLAVRRHVERVDRLLHDVGLAGHTAVRAGDLSHGDQRALELAIS